MSKSTWTRSDVSFPSGETTCAAWLYSPASQEPDLTTPIIVMAHGLGGVKEQRLDAFADRFVDAGYACLVFDYRYFGSSGGQPRQLLDVASQRADWKAAIAFVRGLPTVDPDRVVAWGSSFGGGHAIVTAAQDKRIVATIAQCPFTDGLASAKTTGLIDVLKLATLAVRDEIGSRLGHAPVMVPSYGPPGSTALMNTPDAVSGMEALTPVGTSYPKDVAARIALQIPRNFPGRHAKDVHCPLMVVVCERDTVAPAKQTEKHAAKASKGEVKVYDTGHFDIYVGEWFERVVSDQLDFLARHVPLD
ncbi:alpha/beta fold hydrolase [Nocardia sp. NPDC005825]|uniref:alpha/beta hydrolase n=1 Tax=unclassified Nocardia TaxID=2637762 RepID=UPI0033D161FC